MSTSESSQSFSVPQSCALGRKYLSATLLCLCFVTGSAAPQDGPVSTPVDATDAAAIPVLIAQLGKDRTADAVILSRLRPLLKRHRITGPDRSMVAGLTEDAWFGRLETLWIDRQDGPGRIAVFHQRILHSEGDALRVHALDGELASIADGVSVIISGYRVGHRILVTRVSEPPQEGVP